MKSHEFCYWLQGLFELQNPKQLDRKQTELIRRHLALVFKHDIDPSYPPEQQADLAAIHLGEKQKLLAWKHDSDPDPLIRC